MRLGFPFTKGGAAFCGKEWQYNDMNAGFVGIEKVGVDPATINRSFGTSPMFFGGNCNKVGWNGETGFGLVIGASAKGDIVYGIYLERERLTPAGIDLLVKHYGIDALGYEPEPVAEGPTLAELKEKALELGVPTRFINGAAAEEVKDRIEQVERGEDLKAVVGASVAVEPQVERPYTTKPEPLVREAVMPKRPRTRKTTT